MPGRRPKPTALKIASGNAGKRKIDPREPKTKGVPKPPAYLSNQARKSWFAVMPLLQGMGVVGEPDAFALERLCECHAEIVRLQKVVNEQGHTYECKSEHGTMVRARPEVPMLADADRRFKSYLVEFGLTPAARTKVKTSGGNEDEKPEDEFFEARPAAG